MKNHQSLLPRRAAASLFALYLPLAAAHAAPASREIPNYQTVNDHVFRGGQPTPAGFRNLAEDGIKTIVDLRESDDRSKQEKKVVKALGMRYVNIPMKGMTTPSKKQISQSLKILNDEKAWPVFIHCKRGADRTGVVLACYRVEHDNWTNQESLSEARNLGMSWYQLPLQRYVLAYRPHPPSHGVVDTAEGVADSIREFGEDALDSLKKLPGIIKQAR